ncbi:hypothetical protein [Pseudomonas syringae]|uniref:hypothetical protein n=1 Tax=Pseudomonas syringae TaxID=317 RepID=UPI003F74E070
MTIVPMLRVGMQFWTLCVLCGAARQYHRAKKALYFNYRATLRVGMQFWTLCVLCVALRVTATALEKRFLSTSVLYVALRVTASSMTPR